MQDHDSEQHDVEKPQEQASEAADAPAEQEAVEQAPDEMMAAQDAGEVPQEAELQDEANETEEADQIQDDLLPDGLGVAEVIEAILFATDSPLPAGKIAQVLEQGTSRQVRKHIKQLNERYEQTGMAFRIEEVAGGYQMLTLPKFQPWLAKLLRARQESRLSPTQMETLAIIAYKQPVLRADIEAIRGVAVGDVVNRLRELGLVKIVGRAEDVGRPLLYGTTKKFLRVFGLGSLEDLPRVEELKAPETPKPAEPQPTMPQESTQAEQAAEKQQPEAAQEAQDNNNNNNG